MIPNNLEFRMHLSRTLSEKARLYANFFHDYTNHKYDGDKPYRIHLCSVATFAQTYIYLIPEEDRETVLASCWAHDLIEDTRQTYNDVKAALGEKVADIVYALTNNKGKNRGERAGESYYAGIRAVKYAAFVKLCDRLANVNYSVGTGSRMADMYRRENDSFVKSIWNSDYLDLIWDLRNHLNQPKS
jgi:(p)ppGpp synthase/HD superfamily hydrolase